MSRDSIADCRSVDERIDYIVSHPKEALTQCANAYELAVRMHRQALDGVAALPTRERELDDARRMLLDVAVMVSR